MRKGFAEMGAGMQVGGPARIPGQAGRLLLDRARLRVRHDLSGISALTAPARELTGPVVPNSTSDVVRQPGDVTRGLPLDPDQARQLEQKLAQWAREGNILAFRQEVMGALRQIAPQDLALRAELSHRALQFYKACARISPDRRVSANADREVVQKALYLGADLLKGERSGDWQPIPRTKHPGGLRRRTGTGWEYYYPDQPAQAHAPAPEEPAPAPAPPKEEPHAQPQQTKPPAADWTWSPGQPEGGGDGPPVRRPEPARRAGSKARATRLLVPVERGPDSVGAGDAAAKAGTDAGKEIAASKELRAQLQAGPPAGPDLKPSGQFAGPRGIPLHPDLWPDLATLPTADRGANFPNPADIKDSTGKVVGRVSKLYSHQEEGARRILASWKDRDGALLQDEAGLGKTNTALAAMVEQGGARNLIVVPVAGKHGLKSQWGGATAAGLYGIDLQLVDQMDRTKPGWWIISYDELYETARDPEGNVLLDQKGKPVKQLRPSIFDGKWDAIAFDECHSMITPDGQRTVAAKALQDRASKVLYMSATPFTNVADLHYLTKLGWWDQFRGQTLSPDDFPRAKKTITIDSDEKAFAFWAHRAGALVTDLTYDGVKNPASPLPMAAIAATAHVDGASIKRMISLDGMKSQFGVTKRSDLTAEQNGAFDTADRLTALALESEIHPMLVEALYKGWARQYWETLKAPAAIELGKQALAEGKQVAFFTSFMNSNHEHLRSFSRQLRNRADKLAASDEGRGELLAKAEWLRGQAVKVDAELAKLPAGESIVDRLTREFGGPTQVAEIHGRTNKDAHVEQDAYQAGAKQVVVATMAKGGTGISLHDTTGERPRVQINLSLPWSGREFTQVAGRSYRLGSKTPAQLHWLVGEDTTEQHNAAVVARRLKSMGSLTAGDPELNVDSTALAKWEFGSNTPDSDNANALVKAVEEMQTAVEEGGPLPPSDEAQEARDWFRTYGEQRKAGRNVLQERFDVAQARRKAERWQGARRAAEQMRRQLKWQVRWRPGLGVFEIERQGVASFQEKDIKSAKVGGESQSYGTKQALTYWVRPEGMPALAERLAVHRDGVDLRDVRAELETPTSMEELEDHLTKKQLRIQHLGDGQVAVTGATYGHNQNGAFSGIAPGSYHHGQFRYVIPVNLLPELAARVGVDLPAIHQQAREQAEQQAEQERKERATKEVAQFGQTATLGGSAAQVTWAADIRRTALTQLAAHKTPEAMRLLDHVRAQTSAKWFIDNRFSLGFRGGSLDFNLAKSVSDQDLARLRPRLMLRPATGPMELVWMAEEVPDLLHERAERLPPGWRADDPLDKAAYHKYLKRTPTGNPQRPWRYWYKVPGRAGLTSSRDLVEGTRIKVAHQGRVGHFEVRSYNPTSGIVTVRHDESGRTAHFHEHDLHRMVQAQYRRLTDEHGFQSERPTPPAPPLERITMEDLTSGRFDQIEGFGRQAARLEAQAVDMPKDRDYAVVPQANGFVLVSRERAGHAGPIQVGDRTEVLLRSEQGGGIARRPAEWVVMEADQVVASHDAESFTKRPAYPEGVQERRYESIRPEQEKVDRIARHLEPALLANTNPDPINGAPILTEDNIVLGGNGRAMGIQRAYRLYPEQGQRLKQYLAQHARGFGLSPAQVQGMRAPMLVRRIQAGKDATELARLGRRMNESLTQGLDPRSEQVAVSRFVTPEVVDSLVHHMETDQGLADFLARPASRPFIQQLERAGIIDAQNRAQYIDQDNGLLNQQGRERVQRVLAARMIPNPDLLDRMPDSWRESIAQSVPYLLQAEANGWDVRPALTAAMRADADMQAKGYKRTAGDRRAYLGQGEMFERKDKSPLTATLLAVLQETGGAPRRMARAWKQVALEGARQQHDYGGNLSLFQRPKMEMGDAIEQAFELRVQKGGYRLDLRKAQDPQDALHWYLSQAVTWELANLMRGAGPDLNTTQLVRRLRAFVLDQARHDQDFARALGAHPLGDATLRALVQVWARSHQLDLAKSWARASLQDNLLKSGYPVGTVRQWAAGPFRKVGPNQWVPAQTGGGAAPQQAAAEPADQVSAPPGTGEKPAPTVTGDQPGAPPGGVVEQPTQSPSHQDVSSTPGGMKPSLLGVGAMDVPPPPAIPRLPNLLPDEQAAEAAFADSYQANPDAMVAEYRAKLQARELGDAPNVFSTDDAKLLSPHYNQGKDNLASRALYNVAVHQTANALAKRAFISQLDELAALPQGDTRRTILVTSGGVGAGKGYALSNIPEATSVASQVGAVWDAAGEQNATENPWVLQEARKRGLATVFAYVDSDPHETWENPKRGVIERAKLIGRMVDANPFATSYAEGASNFQQFHEETKGAADAGFLFIQNRGGPKLLDHFPKEALVDRDKLYARASAVLDSRAAELPEHIYRGGTVGRRIWGHR